MPDFHACPCAGATLDRLIQPAVLAILAQGPLHGYKLAERIGAVSIRGGHRPDVSGVYRFLKAMKRKGLVLSRWDVSGSGPAKKCYEITPAGRECLGRWIETLEQFRAGISVLLKVARKSMAGARRQIGSRACCESSGRS